MKTHKQVRRKVAKHTDRRAAREVETMVSDLLNLYDVRMLRDIAEARLGREKARELLIKIVFG